MKESLNKYIFTLLPQALIEKHVHQTYQIQDITDHALYKHLKKKTGCTGTTFYAIIQPVCNSALHPQTTSIFASSSAIFVDVTCHPPTWAGDQYFILFVAMER